MFEKRRVAEIITINLTWRHAIKQPGRARSVPVVFHHHDRVIAPIGMRAQHQLQRERRHVRAREH